MRSCPAAHKLSDTLYSSPFLNELSRYMSVSSYQVQQTKFQLEHRSGVFAPSAHGRFYAEHIAISAADSVIDIGCGSGILSVYAALQGAQVVATDISAEAVALTQHNGGLNNVAIEGRVGGFFGDYQQQFDVILANLPQEIVPSEHALELGAGAAEIDGGQRGNDLLVELLQLAPQYMHSNSRLILPLHTLSDYQHSLKVAMQSFDVRLIAIGDLVAKDFVKQHLDFYLSFARQGTIRLFEQHGNWFTNVYVIELIRKSG